MIRTVQELECCWGFQIIYQQNGIKGLYRGVTPRIGLGVWQTVFMVAFGDIFKRMLNTDGAGH